MLPITAGADPELFIMRGGVVVPCVGLFPGTKDKPYPVQGSKYGLTIQEDNVTLEIGFNPISDISAWRKTIYGVEAELQAEIARVLGPGASYAVAATHQFTQEQLSSPQAQKFGCDPDRLAHERGSKRMAPVAAAMGNTRCAGGHLHVGWDKEASPVPDWVVAKFMDLGYLWSIADGYDRQGVRRGYYGLAGLFRKKDYGVEYRTPSNFWMNDPDRAKSIFNAAQWAISKPTITREIHAQLTANGDWDRIKQSIESEVLVVNYNTLEDVWSKLQLGKEELHGKKEELAVAA